MQILTDIAAKNGVRVQARAPFVVNICHEGFSSKKVLASSKRLHHFDFKAVQALREPGGFGPSNKDEMISFVVPAHNEEAGLGRTLQAIQQSARALGEAFEIIVANDASTDQTAAIGRELGATVVDVNHRQIAATRNSGARAAQGHWIFFVDADTTINPRALDSALRKMRNGAVGGGGPVTLEGPMPLYGHVLSAFIGLWSKLVGFTGGAFMFCTREAFLQTGGFDERMFFAEEGAMALALKRQGRFVVLWERVRTSGRRLRKVTGLQFLKGAVRMLRSPGQAMTTRSAIVQSIWYDSNRADDDRLQTGFWARLSNALLLLIVLIFIAAPVWSFIPWSMTPLETPLGKFRAIVGLIQTHIGLLFFTPVTLILFRNLPWRKPGRQLAMSALLALFCAWQACASARGVGWSWARILMGG